MLSYVLVFFLVVAGFGPWLWEIRTGTFDFFDLKNPFIFYYVLQLGISGLVTLVTGVPSVIGLDPALHRGYYDLALGVALAGMCAFQLGVYTQRPVTFAVPLLVRAPWRSGRAVAMAGVYLTCGYIAFAALMHSLGGGVGAFMAQREAFRAGGVVGQGLLLFPATSLMSLAALVLFLDATVRPKTHRQLPVVLLIFAVSLLPAFIIGFRSLVGLPILQLMVCWNYGYRRIPLRRLALTLGALATGFTLYGVSRAIPPSLSGADAMEAARMAIKADPELVYTVVARSKGTEVLASVIEKLHSSGGYDVGWRAIAEAGSIIVPHAVWRDKPTPFSERFTTYVFGDALAYSRGEIRDVWGGVSPTAAGELYFHFGVIGVVVGLFLLGRLGRVAYWTMLRHSGSRGVILVYAIFFTSFTMFAESFQGYIDGLVMEAIVLTFTFWWLLVVPAPPPPSSAGGRA